MGAIYDAVDICHLLESVDLVKLVRKYMFLKKEHGCYKGQCPFCDGYDFTIYADYKHMYECPDCEIGKNAIDFLMLHEMISFEEAIELLRRGLIWPGRG